MKRLLPFFVALLLLAGCAAPPVTSEPPAAVTVSAPSDLPAVSPTNTPDAGASPTENTPPETDLPVHDDLPGGTPYTTGDGYANMSVVLPDGWQGELMPPDESGCFGIDFWPEDAAENRLELRYRPERIGLCGTGLISEKVACGAVSAAKMQYSDLSAWTLWVFQNTPGEYTLETNAPNRWVAYRGEELDGILGTLVLGEGTIRRDEAERIARTALTGDYEFCSVSFECRSGLYTVRFWNMGVYEEGENVIVDFAGNVIKE